MRMPADLPGRQSRLRREAAEAHRGGARALQPPNGPGRGAEGVHPAGRAASRFARILAIVVTHNRLPRLRHCLARLRAESLDAILVVDCASTDGTAEWLAGLRDPRIAVLRLAENRGGAGGFAAGMAAAMAAPAPSPSMPRGHTGEDDGPDAEGRGPARRSADMSPRGASPFWPGEAQDHPERVLGQPTRCIRGWHAPKRDEGAERVASDPAAGGCGAAAAPAPVPEQAGPEDALSRGSGAAVAGRVAAAPVGERPGAAAFPPAPAGRRLPAMSTAAAPTAAGLTRGLRTFAPPTMTMPAVAVRAAVAATAALPMAAPVVAIAGAPWSGSPMSGVGGPVVSASAPATSSPPPTPPAPGPLAIRPDWLLLLDDDAWPEPGAIDVFRQLVRPAVSGPQVQGAEVSGVVAPGPKVPAAGGAGPEMPGAIAAAVRDRDGRIAEMNRPAHNPFAGPGRFLRALVAGRRGFHVSDADYAGDRPVPVDTASFVGLFLPCAAVAAAGLPESRLFLYGDDVLYTLGLRRAGIALAFEPRIRFVHDCATLSGPARLYRPLWKRYFHHRNLVLVIRAAAGRVLFWPVLLSQILRWTLALRHSDRVERRAAARLMRLALADGLARRLDRDLSAIRAIAEERG